MQRKRSREWVEPTEVQKERFKQALGSYTELGDTKEAERDEQQLFARLGRALIRVGKGLAGQLYPVGCVSCGATALSVQHLKIC